MSFIPVDHNVFVIDIEYIVPLEQVEPHIPAHMDFLETNYARKHFLASGAKVPRSGGIILAIAKSKDEVQEWIKDDPFHRQKLANYKVTEFHPRISAAGLKA